MVRKVTTYLYDIKSFREEKNIPDDQKLAITLEVKGPVTWLEPRATIGTVELGEY